MTPSNAAVLAFLAISLGQLGVVAVVFMVTMGHINRLGGWLAEVSKLSRLNHRAMNKLEKQAEDFDQRIKSLNVWIDEVNPKEIDDRIVRSYARFSALEERVSDLERGK